jgi:hypothetical protein
LPNATAPAWRSVGKDGQLPGVNARATRTLVLLSAAASVAGVCVALTGRARPETPRAAADKPPSDAALARPPSNAALARPPSDAAPAKPPSGAEPGPLRYLALGGGAFPESTEVSLEQDLALALQGLQGPGTLLFAGGQGARAVRVEEPGLRGDALLVELGQLFQPRVGRHSRYKLSELPSVPASREQFERSFGGALRSGTAPLTLYVAAHGEQGESARDNRVVLWGGDGLTVTELARLHASQPRPLRVLMASCYSGGFAELAFEDADPIRGAARAPRCGLFAGTWDRQTSGCDPNPDRAAQEGYSLHLWHALQGRDRDGRELPLADLDFDGDGRIGPLEAHTRARIASRSIDVPTTTSERYLREVERETTPARASRGPLRAARPAGVETLAEEQALLARLGAELRLTDDEAVEARLDALSEQLDALQAELEAAEAALDQAYGTLAARLLGRWPVLDDPYHPEFAALFHTERTHIATALRELPEAQVYRRAQRAVDVLDGRYWALQIDEARVTRLARAHETLRLHARLQTRGGPALRAYQALLRCERAPLP